MKSLPCNDSGKGFGSSPTKPGENLNKTTSAASAFWARECGRWPFFNKKGGTMGKRYYWLKLKNDFFGDKRMKKLRRIAGGDTFTIIYLKMMLASLATEGVLEYEGIEPSFAKELALELDEDPDNVEVTLTFLRQTGLMIDLGEGRFELPEAKDAVGSETASTQRVRAFRARQKALQCNTDETEVKHLCNVEKEIEKEIEKEKEKDKKEKHTPSLSETVNDSELPDAVKTKLNEWLDYKKERKEGYKPTGLRNLITQIENQLSKTNVDAVCDVMSLSMAQGWKGICWERMVVKPSDERQRRIENVKQEHDPTDIDRLREVWRDGLDI